MLSRVYLIGARNITGKPVQHVYAAHKGLQQLCTWAAEPLAERICDQPNTALAVEHAPVQTSRQVVGDSAAAGPADRHGQRNMMPRWPDRQQATEAEGFQSARHMTKYIKTNWQLAAHSIRLSSPDKVMEAYYSCMDQMCCQSEKQLNYVHISAIVHGTAKVWTAAGERHSGWVAGVQAEHNLRNFTARMLRRLQPLLPAVGARLAANVLWASAKLGLDPDALVPGMTDSLARQFMVDMDAATGQGFANVLVACAKLQLNPCQGGLFKAMCGQSAVATLSTFDSQNVANILHSLATLPAAEPSVEMLDALCQRFDVLLNRCQASNRPNELPSAQNIANTIWALSKLKFAPADQLALTMVGRMVALCRLPGQQPTLQAISNALRACVELSVPVKQADTDSLASFFLSSNRRRGTQQHYANTAWSLAVTGHFCQAQFTLMLDQFFALSINHHKVSQPHLRQLYQALDWLQPPPSTALQQKKAWLNLESKMGRLGARPACDPHPGAQLVCSALTQLSLRVQSTPVISGYRTAALLEPIGSAAAIVVAFESNICLMNKRSRLLGSEGFRQQLLKRRGKLVLLAPPKAGVGVKEVAKYLKPILTAVAGGSLDAYRR
ncbi:TPA: hypothetical protein ACH3X1_005217 [Trebouxia sp. C0004]